MNRAPAPFVVLACGNPSRGDDALGPLLLARLGRWLATEGVADRFELIEDFQFQVEHALDLQGRRAALFIDAGSGTPAPYVLQAQLAEATPGHSTHAISPGAVLAVYRRVVGGEPPTTSVLCVRGERFELGDGLSAAGADHLEAAWQQLQAFCRGLLQSGSGKR